MKKLKLTLIIFIIIGIITVSGVFMVNWFVKLSTKDKIIYLICTGRKEVVIEYSKRGSNGQMIK